MTRYAFYFSPAPGSPWWQAGCKWLGRDPLNGSEIDQRRVTGLPPELVRKHTSEARRYGFHATLKAPFRLADGFTESELFGMAEQFSRRQPCIPLEGLRIEWMRNFLALRPALPMDAVNALAMRCVSHFDPLRAAPTAAELAKRRRAGLTERQEVLLQRWGYPYTGEEYRFHMTLSNSLAGLDQQAGNALRRAAEECFAAVMEKSPLVIDALTIFREDSPGDPFLVWHRFPFGG